MGIFDFLFGKKDKNEKMAENIASRPDSGEADVSGEPRPEPDYGCVVEIAGILSNGNPDVERDFTLLSRDHKAFAARYPDWCGEMMEDDPDRGSVILDVTAYWLTGHDTEYKFGGYIDWKEATEEITAHLEEAARNLGYPLNMAEIEFTGEEFTNDALQVIDTYFQAKGYTLVSLDIGGDCYHLFIVPLDAFGRLVALGDGIGLRFFNNFLE